MTNTYHEKHILNLLVKDMFRFVLLFLLFTAAHSFLIAQQDTTPPEISDFSIFPMEIDVTEGDDTVEVTISVSDDLSGLDYMSIYFTSPSGLRIANVSFSDWTSGAISYTGTGILVIQQYWESGEWDLDRIYLSDKMDNSVEYYSNDMENMGFPHSFNVISEEDLLAPELTYFDISPTDIDVSEGYDTVEVTISFSDNISGLDYIYVSFDNHPG